MNYRFAQILLPLMTIAISASVLFSELSSADDQDEHSTKVQPVATPMAANVQAQRDSLFAVIDQSFLTVKPILEKSCFDCHSSTTHYPWYHKIPLIRGLIDSDIKSGRRHVDFSSGFPFSGRGTILEILKGMRSEIDEGGMPLFTYRMIHWGTSIDGARQDTLFTWIDSTVNQITAFYDREKIPYKK